MRLIAICVSLLLAFIPVATAKALSDPTDVYVDFANHGRLTKQYPSALLRAIVNDASLNQYGDPLVMMRLRRAARLQLQTEPVRTSDVRSKAPTASAEPLLNTKTLVIVAVIIVLAVGALRIASARAQKRG
jgi:hypothetical protein